MKVFIRLCRCWVMSAWRRWGPGAVRLTPPGSWASRVARAQLACAPSRGSPVSLSWAGLRAYTDSHFDRVIGSPPLRICCTFPIGPVYHMMAGGGPSLRDVWELRWALQVLVMGGLDGGGGVPGPFGTFRVLGGASGLRALFVPTYPIRTRGASTGSTL